MRIAVSGSHNTGKSTLIAAFLGRRPQYVYEPEAFEDMADDIDLTSAEGPTPEGLRSLLEYTATAVTLHEQGACVIYERSPVDYLAYAAASLRNWPRDAIASFLATQVPVARAALRHLDLIAFVPISAAGPVQQRAGEDVGFRKRVDANLRRALVDDAYDLFGGGESPRVVELSPLPERQLLELIRLTGTEPGA